MKQTLPKNSGFGLVELTTVMAIIGILAGLSMTTFSQQLRKERLKASTRNSVSWLESIQDQAIQQNKICEIIISKTSNTASPTISDNSNVNPNNQCENINTHTFESSIAALTDDPNSSTSCSLGATNDELRITFTARGTLPCGGEIQLISEDSKTRRCIKLIAPLGLVREGLMKQGSESCDYTSAH